MRQTSNVSSGGFPGFESSKTISRPKVFSYVVYLRHFASEAKDVSSQEQVLFEQQLAVF
jgi:hypothetical protein